MTVPVMVLRNKANPERYLAASADVGDWDDENLDVTIKDIHSAYMIIRKDLSPPTMEDFENEKSLHAEHKRRMIERFGEGAFISMDFEEVCDRYDPVVIEITGKQYEDAEDLSL